MTDRSLTSTLQGRAHLPPWLRAARTFLLLALLGLVAAGSWGCNAFESEASEEGSEEETEEDEAVPVEVSVLGSGPMESILRFSTNLEAEEAVAVHAQAAQLVEVLRVEEGQRVSKGELLVRLRDDEQRNEVTRVESQLARARREYERQERLWKDQLIAEQDFNDATYELEQLELALQEARLQLSYTEVRAPITGTVTRRLVNLGDRVTVNQHLFDLVDFGSIVARIYVPEKELARLQVGQPARLTAPALGDASFTGRVDRLSPVVDPQSGTVKVTVAIPRPGALRPGLYVDVDLVTETLDEAVLVPKRALVYDRDQTYVYRVSRGPTAAETTVERLLVETALEDETHVTLEGVGGEDPLSVGDRLVVAGQAGLKNGAEVRVLTVDGQAAALADGQVAGGEARADSADEAER